MGGVTHEDIHPSIHPSELRGNMGMRRTGADLGRIFGLGEMLFSPQAFIKVFRTWGHNVVRERVALNGHHSTSCMYGWGAFTTLRL